MQIKGKCKAGNAVRWRRKRKRAKGKGVTELEVVVSSSSSTTSFHPSPSPAQTWPGRFGRRFWLDATKLAGSHLASPRLCLITNMSFLFGQYYSTASWLIKAGRSFLITKLPSSTYSHSRRGAWWVTHSQVYYVTARCIIYISWWLKYIM